MRLNEIYKIADESAPKVLSDRLCAKYGMYDNSGILVDVGADVKGVLFSLDLTFGGIREAVRSGKNLIVTHHPAIYSKLGRLCVGDGTESKLIECVKHGISVISMHLNLDSADGGIDESLMRGIMLASARANGKQASENYFAGAKSDDYMLTVESDGVSGAYGRVYGIEKTPLTELSESLKTVFQTGQVCVYGDGAAEISRVASFCGAGADEGALAFARRNGADAIVSSDFKHHIILAAREQDMSVIALTHYASENYGFEKYYQKIRRRLEIPCEFYTDEELL